MRPEKKSEDTEEHQDRFAEKYKRLAMVALALVGLIFLAGVTSVLAMHMWPHLFESFLFSS